MRHFVDGDRINACIVAAILETEGDVGQEHLEQFCVFAQILLYHSVVNPRPLLHHHGAACAQAAQDPYPEIGRRKLYGAVVALAGIDIVPCGIVHDAPAEEGRIRRRI